jgi:hypothetical protein
VVFELVQMDPVASHASLRAGGVDLSHFGVRVYYNKGIGSVGSSGANTTKPFDTKNLVEITGCTYAADSSGDKLCRLDEFFAATAAVTEANWQAPCGLVAPAAAPKGDKEDLTKYGIGIGIGSAVGGLALGAVVVFLCMRKKGAEAVSGGAPYNQL